MNVQVRSIEELTLTELFAVKEDQGDNTPEAVLKAIEEKLEQQKVLAANKPVLAPSVK